MNHTTEVQAAINGTTPSRKRATSVVWDKAAAVKYAFWGDQWISFDDADTFKQKIDYANKLGIGGTLIWAIDQGKLQSTNDHDGDYNAMSAISGTVGLENPSQTRYAN
ncbi:Chitinase 5 [Ceratobasidium sp. 414]|nr:Chitinase 5 [Ceratobasidium sp. 414]